MPIFILLTFVLSSVVFAQKDSELEALKKRVEQLETQQEEMLVNQRPANSDVHSFLRDDLSLGGFFEAAHTSIGGPDTRRQSMFSSSTMGLNIAAEFQNNIRFVNQTLTILTYPLLNPHNNPTQTPNKREFGDPVFAATVTIGYIEFPLNPDILIQTGVGYVPFGFAAQQRELVLFIRRGGPQVLRTTNLIQPLWSGVHLQGDLRGLKGGYNLYTMNTMDRSNSTGLGGRFWLNSEDDVIRGGISTQVMKFDGHTSEIVGADLRIDTDRFIITSEYVNHMTGEGRNPWTAYLEPAVKLKGGEVLLFVFTDYADDPFTKLGATTFDPMIRWENGLGVNWLPTSNTRFRATAAREDYLGRNSTYSGENRDFWYFDLSAGVAF